jgi:hypothetical protein
VDDCEALAAALAETLLSQPDKSLLRARAAAFTVARCISGYEALIDKLRPSRVQ